ncbi:MAG: GGDEF domain-containing protein, partial [Parasporobacterium sp.]|nr:GGDEF domain-containing protein [Parasporobacterium sp.]
MSSVIYIRPEIVCIVIQLFILYTARAYNIGKHNKAFKQLLYYGLFHTVFDLVTVITVNDIRSGSFFSLTDIIAGTWTPTTMGIINWICHIIFYQLALMFTHEFMCYVAGLCFTKKTAKRIRHISMGIQYAALIIMPFLPAQFLQFHGTRSSYGPVVFFAYGLVVLYFASSLILLIFRRKKINKHAIRILLPMILFAMAVAVVQAFVPELLFTGAASTLLSVAFFFSLENPLIVFRSIAQIDALTGVKTRGMYEEEIKHMEEDYVDGTSFIFVFADINDLKFVNDFYGHAEGDQYISQTALAFKTGLTSSESIYRMGGDEFMAVYRDKNEELVTREIKKVTDFCKKEDDNHVYTFSVSIGYAATSPEFKTLSEVVRSADYQMYLKKLEMKKQRAVDLNSDNSMPVAGLTDRLFEALADTDSDIFAYVLNMNTGVSRWTAAGVKYFGLEGEYMEDFLDKWSILIDPEQRRGVVEDIKMTISQLGHAHDRTYKVRNAKGMYVTVNCKGRV